MAGPLLIDVGCLCDEHTDAALEFMAKAIGEDPPESDIWAPHPNPYVRRIVELFTDRGLSRIEGVREELGRWLRGAEHQHAPAAPSVRPSGAMRRWDATELAVVRLYLQNLPPTAWQLDDWMMLVDYLTQRYLPEADLRSEAEWLTTRSAMMGRVAAAAAAEPSEAEADAYLAALPVPAVSPALAAAIEYGRARCAELVTGLSDSARHRIRRLIVDYQENVALGNRAATSESLQSKLLDAFGVMNRDWRTIAVTEATEMANQGFVASVEPGAKLRRVEKYRGACPFCRSIDGRVFTAVSAADPKKDGETDIWPGKTNVGRAASPRRRVGGALIDREPHERWWPAAGGQHPNCRGSWVRVGGASDDPEFEAWLKQLKGAPA